MLHGSSGDTFETNRLSTCDAGAVRNQYLSLLFDRVFFDVPRCRTPGRKVGHRCRRSVFDSQSARSRRLSPMDGSTGQ